MRCLNPPNRLLMMRTGGLQGPMLQSVGGGVCVRSQGVAFAPGGGLAGVKAVSGVVVDETTIAINFNACVSVPGPGFVGIEYRIDGGVWTVVTAAAKISDTQWQFTTGTIAAGQLVEWRYVGGSNTIVDCVGPSDIGDQGPLPVDNPLGAEAFILLETGDGDLLLVEEGDGGVKTEEST